MTAKTITTISILWAILLAVALACASLTNERAFERTMADVLDGFRLLVLTSFFGMGAFMVLVVVVGVVVGFALAGRLIGHTWQGYKLRNAQIERLQAEAIKDLVTVAPPGHNVYLHTDRVTTTPLHLMPGRANGHPIDYTQAEIDRWQQFNLLHSGRGDGRRPELLIEPPQQTTPPLLPLLLNSQRLIITGGSDAGKTTLVKHMIAGRAERGQIVVIDPHAPSKLLGFDVIGAGRDYASIGQALESLVWLMNDRYGEVRDGLADYGQHELVSVFIDEWTSIKKYVERAGEFFEALLTESRKINILITLIAHSPNVDTLGISAAIRQSARVVEITGGQGEPRRAFVHPASKYNPDGSKARPKEYALPGLFPGYPATNGNVIERLPTAPTSDEYKVIDMLRQQASNYEICKQMKWSRGESSYGRIEDIKQRFMDVQKPF